MSEQSRIERLLETGQISFHDAALMQGEGVTAPPVVREGRAALTASGVRPPRRRYSRRGGRAYPEPSDSELDSHYNVPYERIDAEEAAKRREEAEERHLERLRERLRKVTSHAAWRDILVEEHVRRDRAGLPYNSDIYAKITEGIEEPAPDSPWNIRPR